MVFNSFIHHKQYLLDEGWIERCEQSGHGISWEGVASLVKATHHNGDTNITQRKINLVYGLKDKQENILINNSTFFCKLHIDVHVDFFPTWKNQRVHQYV